MIDPLPDDIFRKGQVLNNTYEIEGVLGRGGTGEVYRARNQITGRVVAVKALNRAFSANDAYIELMKREEEMRSISSDAVVRYTDCSRSAEGHVYLVMDYVDGTALSDWLARGGADPRDLLIVAHRVAVGLIATHARGIVHRDLSPDNVVLRAGDPAQAVIIDFGIAKDANEGARTIVGNDFAGKYEYAAPEQMYGRAEQRSDLYALGASLLATFRGRVPDLGRSPGEIIARKQKPLDTEGVPEPLRGLIEDLTQPDPARRPPSAASIATAIEALLKPTASAPARARRRGRRRWPWVAALLLAALVAGGWYLGRDLIAPATVPVASPYELSAARGADGAATLSGNAPDADARATLLDAFAAAAGASAAPKALTLADGAPVEAWAPALAQLLAIAAPLETWHLAVSDRDATLDGVAPNAAARDTAAGAFAEAAATAGFTPQVRIAAGPLHLTVADVEAVLGPLATCGPLAVAPPAGEDFPLGATVVVTGDVADAGAVERLRAGLAAAIGDRTARVEAITLNPGLCSVLSLLPPVPSGGISVHLGFGNGAAPNLSGVYRPGDNPVIDLLMPAEPSDGYLWVAVADVTGNLYNLLPNIGRPQSAVAELGEVAAGIRRVRVAHSLAEARDDPSKPAFTVDENFGRSLLIVIHSDRPLFDTLRPTTETIASFSEDLGRVLQAGQVRIVSIATRVIDSRG